MVLPLRVGLLWNGGMRSRATPVLADIGLQGRIAPRGGAFSRSQLAG
jgi:hypothetical protein